MNEEALAHWGGGGAVAQETNEQAIFKALNVIPFGFILVVFGI
jgi:hypothetical protein